MLHYRRHRRNRRGRALVEAALVLPVVLMFLFGVLDYGRYVMLLQVVTNAAREGARYAMTHSQPVVIQGVTYGNATSDVTSIINKSLAGQSLSGQTIQVYASDTLGNNIGPWSGAQAGQSICVKITGNFIPILPKLLYLPTSIAVQGESVMRSEAN